MIWHFRISLKPKRKCIECNKGGLEKGFSPKYPVSKEVADLLYDLMSTFEGTKSKKLYADTGKYRVKTEHHQIFCSMFRGFS